MFALVADADHVVGMAGKGSAPMVILCSIKNGFVQCLLQGKGAAVALSFTVSSPHRQSPRREVALAGIAVQRIPCHFTREQIEA